MEVFDVFVYTAGMNTIQYTIRDIPKNVDVLIRKRAKREGKSFNKTVVEIISAQVMGSSKGEPSIFEKLRSSHVLDDGFDEAIKLQSQIDPDIWK